MTGTAPTPALPLPSLLLTPKQRIPAFPRAAALLCHPRAPTSPLAPFVTCTPAGAAHFCRNAVFSPSIAPGHPSLSPTSPAQTRLPGKEECWGWNQQEGQEILMGATGRSSSAGHPTFGCPHPTLGCPHPTLGCLHPTLPNKHSSQSCPSSATIPGFPVLGMLPLASHSSWLQPQNQSQDHTINHTITELTRLEKPFQIKSNLDLTPPCDPEPHPIFS